MPFASLLANTSFDPEAVETLSAAFDDAWEKFKQSGSALARPAYERDGRPGAPSTGRRPERTPDAGPRNSKESLKDLRVDLPS